MNAWVLLLLSSGETDTHNDRRWWEGVEDLRVREGRLRVMARTWQGIGWIRCEYNVWRREWDLLNLRYRTFFFPNSDMYLTRWNQVLMQITKVIKFCAIPQTWVFLPQFHFMIVCEFRIFPIKLFIFFLINEFSLILDGLNNVLRFFIKSGSLTLDKIWNHIWRI